MTHVDKDPVGTTMARWLHAEKRRAESSVGAGSQFYFSARPAAPLHWAQMPTSSSR